jgi:hypothetical protein
VCQGCGGTLPEGLHGYVRRRHAQGTFIGGRTPASPVRPATRPTTDMIGSSSPVSTSTQVEPDVILGLFEPDRRFVLSSHTQTAGLLPVSRTTSHDARTNMDAAAAVGGKSRPRSRTTGFGQARDPPAQPSRQFHTPRNPFPFGQFSDPFNCDRPITGIDSIFRSWTVGPDADSLLTTLCAVVRPRAVRVRRRSLFWELRHLPPFLPIRAFPIPSLSSRPARFAAAGIASQLPARLRRGRPAHSRRVIALSSITNRVLAGHSTHCHCAICNPERSSQVV